MDGTQPWELLGICFCSLFFWLPSVSRAHIMPYSELSLDLMFIKSTDLARGS